MAGFTIHFDMSITVVRWSLMCTPSPVSGSIEHAECTQPEDARKIRAEIGGESDEVDFAIQVGNKNTQQ